MKDDIEAKLSKRGGKMRALRKEDFSQKGSIFLRPEAQFDSLVAMPDSEDRAKAIIGAMESIEKDYENLRGVLPKGDYQELDNEVTASIDVEQRLERELKRDYHIITADNRLDQVARDFVQHFSTAWESDKAMLVCIDKITCLKMHALIVKYWDERISELEAKLPQAADEQEEIYTTRQIQWMKETRAAVVVSEEQGEVEKFQKWGLDIKPHRKLIKEGMGLPESMRQKPKFRSLQRKELDEAFKHQEHPFRIAIVCPMWLTGFDVPSLSTLYLDKPLKAHTLMQAIARANRVNEGKNNGLIVDYCGILKNLRKAPAP